MEEAFTRPLGFSLSVIVISPYVRRTATILWVHLFISRKFDCSRSPRSSQGDSAISDRPELPNLTRATKESCSSVIEHRQVELAEALGIGDHLDLDDLAVRDGETECSKQSSTWSHDESH